MLSFSYYKKISPRVKFFISLIFCLIFALVYINYSFEVGNISVSFSDDAPENASITRQIELEFHNNLGTLFDLLVLDKALVTKLVRDDNQVVNRVEVSYRWKIGTRVNIVADISTVVVKNDRFFIGCVAEEYKDNFLVHSMVGNSSGEFYQETSDTKCSKFGYSEEPILRMFIHPKSLFSVDKEDRLKDPDSLSGSRLYRSNDFKSLKLLLDSLLENGFTIHEIFVNDLKLVDFDLGSYILKTSLEKDPKDTIADFETISKSGKLQRYINEDKEKIEYIDLSFKDKVFYKLKNNTKIDTMSTTTNAKELLD